MADYVHWRRQRWLNDHASHGEEVWPPKVVVLELVEGCPLRCPLCGVRGIREDDDRSLKFMEPWVWQKVERELRERCWPCRILLTGRGEPAMHPQLDRIL